LKKFECSPISYFPRFLKTASLEHFMEFLDFFEKKKTFKIFQKIPPTFLYGLFWNMTPKMTRKMTPNLGHISNARYKNMIIFSSRFWNCQIPLTYLLWNFKRCFMQYFGFQKNLLNCNNYRNCQLRNLFCFVVFRHWIRYIMLSVFCRNIRKLKVS